MILVQTTLRGFFEVITVHNRPKWWTQRYEETKLLIAMWSEEKLVWDQVSQGMAEGGFTGSVHLQHCIKINNLKQKYCKICNSSLLSHFYSPRNCFMMVVKIMVAKPQLGAFLFF